MQEPFYIDGILLSALKTMMATKTRTRLAFEGKIDFHDKAIQNFGIFGILNNLT